MGHEVFRRIAHPPGFLAVFLDALDLGHVAIVASSDG